MKHESVVRTRPAHWLMLFLFLTATVLACSDKPTGRQALSRETPVMGDPAPPVEQDEEFVDAIEEDGPPEYVYSPIGKRDPFRSPFLDLVAIEMERGPQERLGPLQRWDLDQLVLRAVISATADPMAMVVDPEGHGHVVRRGVLMGRNWGRVTAIRRECLVITEQMRDATGTPMAVQQERCLPKDDREVRFEEQMRRQVQ